MYEVVDQIAQHYLVSSANTRNILGGKFTLST